MHSTTKLFAGLLFGLLLAGCQADESFDGGLDSELLEAINAAGYGSADQYALPESTDYDAIPQDPNNPLTAEKIALGKLLFHETALGTDGRKAEMAGTYSCASCHHAAGGFQAGRWQGIGEGGVGFGDKGEGRTRSASMLPSDLDVQPLRSPTVLNSGYQKVMLWNGQFGATDQNEGTEAQWTAGTPKAVNALGFEGVETQAIAGLKVHRLQVNATLLDEYGYRDLFDEAFDDVPESERYNRTTAGLAIAAYERTVLANRAPFQDWLKGDNTAMSDAEKRGAMVFFGDAGCVSCHNGPSLASMSFHALGMADLHDNPEPVIGSSENQAAHKGRGGFTMRSEDMYAFKTPQLYNLKDSKFYGHGSSFRSIADVVDYKMKAEPQNARVGEAQLSPAFQPKQLTREQRSDLIAFLEDALHDPALARYEPEGLPSGHCFPNADALSRADQGCD